MVQAPAVPSSSSCAISGSCPTRCDAMPIGYPVGGAARLVPAAPHCRAELGNPGVADILPPLKGGGGRSVDGGRGGGPVGVSPLALAEGVETGPPGFDILGERKVEPS